MREDGQMEVPKPPEEASVMGGLLWCISHNIALNLEAYTRSVQMNLLHPTHYCELIRATNDLYWLARHAANYDRSVQDDREKIDNPWKQD